VAAIFLDLPLLTSEDTPHAPYLAVAADPWPGEVAVLSAPEDAGYALDRVVGQSAAIGTLLDPLPAAAPGRWDRGAPVRVRLATGGPLSSVGEAALLAGANALAVGDGSPGGWEVLQAREAVLVGPDTYALSMRLRGQLGTEADMAGIWPEGSRVVVLDPALVQPGLSLGGIGVDRHFLIGPAGLPLEDPAMRRTVITPRGTGLRPYAPVHLRGEARADGGMALSWVRRTRIGGDSWAGTDVPLGEERERYVVRVVDGAGGVLRRAEVDAPGWVWGADERAADAGAVAVEVAQLSAIVGAGPYRRLEIDG
jgi:hypothetical protein